jgi:very-short-patch-repair endonuclease
MSGPKGNKNALGYRHTEEAKKHLADIARGKEGSEKQRQTVIALNKSRSGQPGHLHTEESRRKIAEAHRARWNDPEWRAKRAKQLREAFEQPEAIEKMREGVTAHWSTISYEERLERNAAGRKASLEANPTSIEIKVSQYLENLGIQFIEQKQEGPYFLDFYLPVKRVIVEAMGCYFHSCAVCGKQNAYKPDAPAYDARRKNYLEKRGYHVIWIWEHDINRDVEFVLRPLLEKCGAIEYPTG